MISAKVETKKQLEVCLKEDKIGEIIIARDSFDEKELKNLVSSIKKAKKKAGIMLERISRYEEFKDLRVDTDKIFDIELLDKIIVQNIDSFSYVLRKYRFAKNENLQVELNYTMNCYNKETKELYKSEFAKCMGSEIRFTAPVELNTHEIIDVGYDTLVVYGYVDTMVSANCLYKNTSKKCKKEHGKGINQDVSYIIDRKSKHLNYKTYCKYCYNKIFNTDVTYLLDMEDELETIGLGNNNIDYRYDFTIENENEVRKVLNGIKPTNFTRGHIKKSIL